MAGKSTALEKSLAGRKNNEARRQPAGTDRDQVAIRHQGGGRPVSHV